MEKVFEGQAHTRTAIVIVSVSRRFSRRGPCAVGSSWCGYFPQSLIMFLVGKCINDEIQHAQRSGRTSVATSIR